MRRLLFKRYESLIHEIMIMFDVIVATLNHMLKLDVRQFLGYRVGKVRGFAVLNLVDSFCRDDEAYLMIVVGRVHTLVGDPVHR